MIETIQNILDDFNIISLEGLNKAALLNRQDKKYIFPESKLPEMLMRLKPDYSLLKIDENSVFKYKTLYFDTPDFSMFHEHKRGKLNRYKVRKRLYCDSGQTYLEIKFKTNKNRTIKTRTIQSADAGLSGLLDEQFLTNKLPYRPDELIPVLENCFQRLSFTDFQFSHRITIDFDITFRGTNSEINDKIKLENLAILELKTPRELKNIPVHNVLRTMRIRPSGISKYCIGKSITEPTDLPLNLMKPKLRKIEKICGNNLIST